MCRAAVGITCGFNTTVANVNISHGRWRHSRYTVETYECMTRGDWSPCVGGASAERAPTRRRLESAADAIINEGDGYCAPEYFGPKCQVREVCKRSGTNSQLWRITTMLSLWLQLYSYLFGTLIAWHAIYLARSTYHRAGTLPS